MGVLDTLSNWNESYREKADAVIDNERVSIQDKTRGAIQTFSDAPTDEDEFARESKRFFQGINYAVGKPGRIVGEKTEGTAVDNPATDAAVRGGETVYDWFVKYPATVGYGTVTGADIRGEEPEHASGDYTPGMLDSLELLAIGAPAAKVGKAGAVAAKGGKGSMGILSKLTRRADDVVDASKASDETVQTQAKLSNRFSRSDSTARRATKTPDEITAGGYGSVKEAVMDNKLLAGVVGGTAALGASGIVGGEQAWPTNYERADRFSAPPGGILVEEKANDDTVLGYWVVIDTEGQTHTILTPGGGTGSVEFPTSREPSFSSRAQARDAFTTFSRRYQRGSQEATPTYADDPPAQQSDWHQTTTVTSLQSGWNLYQQKRRGEEKYRYIVAGTDSNDRTLYISPGGTASASGATFPDREQAMNAYREWKDNADNGAAGAVPDESTQRPTTDDVAAGLRGSGGSGSLGSIGTIAMGAGAVIAAILLWRVLL